MVCLTICGIACFAAASSHSWYLDSSGWLYYGRKLGKAKGTAAVSVSGWYQGSTKHGPNHERAKGWNSCEPLCQIRFDLIWYVYQLKLFRWFSWEIYQALKDESFLWLSCSWWLSPLFKAEEICLPVKDMCNGQREKQDTVHRNVLLPCTAMAFLSITVPANTSFLKIARDIAENPNRLNSGSVQWHKLAQRY